jgi:O-antigen biosynthesis protein
MQVHCPGRPGEEDKVTAVHHVKLFRNRPDLRFEGRIHEQIVPAIRRADGDIVLTDLFVVHSGYDHSPEGQERKKKRDLHLLHLELSEQPEHPFTLFNLGMTYSDIGQFAEAAGYLKRSIARSGNGESHLRKAYALLSHVQERLGDLEAAWQTCMQGLGHFRDDPELLFRKAALLHARGRPEEAIAAYYDVMAARPEPHFSSIVRGLQGHLARYNLAVLYEETGKLPRAEEQWRLACSEEPGYRAGWRGLGENLLKQQKRPEAAALARQMSATERLRGEARLLAARLAEDQGNYATAQREFEAAVKYDPADPQPLQALCRYYFERGLLPEAEGALRKLSQRLSNDGGAPYNLGTVYMRMGKAQAATEAFQDSLKRRPDWPTTYLSLGYALRDCGRPDEAVEAWRKTLQLDPANKEAGNAIEATLAHKQPGGMAAQGGYSRA